MSIFSRRQPRVVMPEMGRRPPASPPQQVEPWPPDRRPTPPAVSTDEARRRVKEAVDHAREELDALIDAECDRVESRLDASTTAAEERLRGKTERRIDVELERIDGVERKLRGELRRMVRDEIAKAKAPAKAAAKSSRKKTPVG